MDCKLMVLPNKNFEKIRVVRLPDDYDTQEAFRHATGVLAGLEEENPDYDWDDATEALERCGFETLPYMLGPDQS